MPEGVCVVAQFNDIATIRVQRGRIEGVRAEGGVASLKAPEPRGFGLAPDVEFDPIESPEDLLESGPWIYERRPPSLPETGRGVIVGVVDWGFDFAHADFRHDDGHTRILALWDQRPPPSPGSPHPYGYGIVHSAEDINHALAAEYPYAALGYHPADADIGGRTHGTHVASIAAGNGRGCGLTGVAPEADLVFVHLSTWDHTEHAKLGDSVTLLEAVHFIVRTADKRPWVINLSMGRHGEHHDGLTPVEQALDAALRSAPGGCIVQSCGNYFQRRIHASGQLRPAEKRTLVWEIEDADVTPNKLEVWYEGRDVFDVEIRSPDGSISAQAALGERASLTAGGRDIGTVYHRDSEPNTLDNDIEIILDRDGPTGPWELTLIGKDVVDGRFHCWIERDSGCAPCQSHFRPEDVVPSYTTGTICNGLRTIAVGACNPHSPERELAPFSSCGPTRDDRVKPDLIAPGESILAARSAPRDPRAEVPPCTLMSGTSMAAPHVAGTIACMFEAAERPLRIEVTRNLLLANTERVTGPEKVLDRVGSGYLDITRAVEAARRFGSGAPQLQPSLYQRTEGDTVNRENDISSNETWDQEFLQDIGESNEPNDSEVASFEETGFAEEELLDDDKELESEIYDQQFFERGAGREAYAGDEHEFGRELVELADEVISAGKVYSPAGLLSELLSKAGVMAPGRPLGAEHINPTSPAALFDAFTSDKLLGLREYFTQFFEVVALPRSRIENDLHSGDCLVRRALGEGNLAHVATLVTGEVFRAKELASIGLRPERWRPGLYAEVIDAGPFPHRLEDKFARRLGDENGHVSHDSLILRIRHDTQSSLRPFFPENPEDVPSQKKATKASFVPAFDNLTGWSSIGLAVGGGIKSGLFKESAASSSKGIVDGADDFTVVSGKLVKRLFGRSILDDGKVARVDPSDASKFQLRVSGRICYPSDPKHPNKLAGSSPVPVVVLLHGNHEALSFGDPKEAGTEKVELENVGKVDATLVRFNSVTEVGNHLGYEDLQKELARYGIASISVDNNLANFLGCHLESRAEMLLATLDEWKKQADAAPKSPYHGMLDFLNVGFMGHSRGGDAVVHAVKNNPKRTTNQYGVRAVCSLSPTDFTGSASNAMVLEAADLVLAESDPAVNLTYLVVYGSLDGDVAGWSEGSDGPFKTFTGTGFRLYDRATCQKAMVFVRGACHNRFNTNWGTEDAVIPTDPDLLKADRHLEVSRFYVGGFFRWLLRGETTLQRRFTGDEKPPSGVTIALQWSMGAEVRPIDSFEDPTKNEFGVKRVMPFGDVIRFGDLKVDSKAQGKSIAHATRIIDANPKVEPRVPTVLLDELPYPLTPSSDWDRFTYLTFRVGRWFDLTARPFTGDQPHIRVRIKDDDDKEVTVPESDFFTKDVPGKPFLHEARQFDADGNLLPDLAQLTLLRLETVRIPLSMFKKKGVNLKKVRMVAFDLDKKDKMHVFIDSLELVRI